MDKFDLKKFLTENKLTKTSVLREGLGENKTEHRDHDEYDNYDEWLEAIEDTWSSLENLNLKPGETESFKSYFTKAKKGEESRYAGSWNANTNKGIVKHYTPYKSPDVGTENLPYYGNSNENLRAKIKEMIIAELDGAAVTDSYYDPVSEGEDYEDAGVETGEVGEKDYEDYQELKKFLNTLKDTKASDDIFNYGSEIDPNEGYDEFDAQYDEKFKLSEYFLDEAKKDEEEAPAEEAPEEEVDATLDTTDTGEDFNVDTSAVDPNIKAVQDALTQAQAAAKNINDDKLTQQIGNTITMFTRTHIANTEAPVNEGKSLTDSLTPEEKKIYDKVKNTITYTGMKKYNSKEYSKKLQKALQAAAMHNEESER